MESDLRAMESDLRSMPDKPNDTRVPEGKPKTQGLCLDLFLHRRDLLAQLVCVFRVLF